MANNQRVQRRLPDRTHHYIDIENLVCTGKLTATAVTWAKACWDRAVAPGEMDLFTIGCDFANVLEARRIIPGARIVCGRGPDGADLALIEAMRFDMMAGYASPRVTVGSGDHIFAPVLSDLAARGVETRVVGIRGHTSAQLRLAAHQTTLLTAPFTEWIAA